jgi:hypothetical protein
MAIVKRAHGGDQRDRLVGASILRDGISQGLKRVDEVRRLRHDVCFALPDCCLIEGSSAQN